MYYSNKPGNCRVDFFTPAGKWQATESFYMDLLHHDNDPQGKIRGYLNSKFAGKFKNATAVIMVPYTIPATPVILQKWDCLATPRELSTGNTAESPTGADRSAPAGPPTEFNVNEYVEVKLTKWGREVHRKNHDNLFADSVYSPPKEDKEGWSRWQMWVLMKEFGAAISMRKHEQPFETTIRICQADD